MVYNNDVKEESERLKIEYEHLDKEGTNALKYETIVKCKLYTFYFLGVYSCGNTLPEEELRQIFLSLDLDHNEVIDPQEFLQGALNAYGAVTTEIIRREFCYMDKMKVGRLMKDEIIKIIGLGWLNEKDIDMMITKIDTGNDGIVMHFK